MFSCLECERASQLCVSVSVCVRGVCGSVDVDVVCISIPRPGDPLLQV